MLEPLRGYLTLAQRLFEHGPAFAEAWNFGPHEEDAKPVGWIVEKMGALWGHSAHWNVDERQHPHEAHHLKLDISKARVRLGWQPAMHLSEALSLVVEWNKQRQGGADTRALTLSQIQTYQNLST